MKRFKLFLIFVFIPLIALALDQSWQVHKSTHFLIYYKNAKEATLNELALKVEDYYNKITDDLGFRRFNFWTWDNRAKIYLFDNQQEYMSQTGEPDWSAGQAQVNSKLIQTFVTARGFLDNVLPHELAHIIFREMVGFDNSSIPLWLDEGVASYQEQEHSFVKEDLANKIRQGDFISFDNLNKFEVADLRTTNDVVLFYTESYSLVKYLIEEFGKDQFVLFCQNIRDKQDLARSLRSVYPFNNLADFESAWKNYILK